MLIGVIGSGTWGTVIALQIAQRQNCLLWGRRAEKIAAIRADEHPQLGPLARSARLRCTSEASDLGACSLLFWAIPTPYTRAQANALRPYLPAGVPIVSLAKGIEIDSLSRVTDILAECLDGERPLAALSGPSHAEEVLAGQPAGLVAAGPESLSASLIDLLHGETLRIYTSADLLGVELAAALKNVIAIAAGICEGAQLGDNAKATLITRGLAEVRRLGRALGADDTTFAGLAGIGDLLTTCYSPHGRNRALGLAIGRGERASDWMAASAMIAEGATTSRAASTLATRHGIDMPITRAVEAAVWHDRSFTCLIRDLLARCAKEENA